MDYYIFKGDESFGPHSIKDLRQYDLNPGSKIWRGGLTSWTEAENLPELAELLAEIEAEKEAEKIQDVPQPEPSEMPYEEDSPTTVIEEALISPNNDLPDSVAIDKEYYVGLNGKEAGPYTLSQLKELQITSSTLVWTDGMPQWQEAHTFPELSSCFGNDNQPTANVAWTDTDAYQTETDNDSVSIDTLISKDLAKAKAKVWVTGIFSGMLIFGGFMSLGLPTLIPAMPVIVLLLLTIDKIDGTKKTTTAYKAKSLYKAMAYSNAIITIWIFTIVTLALFVAERSFMEKIFDYIISFRHNF